MCVRTDKYTSVVTVLVPVSGLSVFALSFPSLAKCEAILGPSLWSDVASARDGASF